MVRIDAPTGFGNKIQTYTKYTSNIRTLYERTYKQHTDAIRTIRTQPYRIFTTVYVCILSVFVCIMFVFYVYICILQNKIHLACKTWDSFVSDVSLPQQPLQRLRVWDLYRMIGLPHHSPWIDVELNSMPCSKQACWFACMSWGIVPWSPASGKRPRMLGTGTTHSVGSGPGRWKQTTLKGLRLGPGSRSGSG